MSSRTSCPRRKAACGGPRRIDGDAADRLIAAAAILESALLVTKDEQIQKSNIVRTVW